MKFTGTKNYVATDDLKVAVNASIVLEFLEPHDQRR